MMNTICAGASALLVASATAIAAAPRTSLPAVSGKLTECHKTLYELNGHLAVHAAYGTQKAKHPAKSLLSCKNANAVVLAGKRYYSTPPFGVGKHITVGRVNYTLGKWDKPYYAGRALSGPLYGWFGAGAVIVLENPSG